MGVVWERCSVETESLCIIACQIIYMLFDLSFLSLWFHLSSSHTRRSPLWAQLIFSFSSFIALPFRPPFLPPFFVDAIAHHA